MVVQEREIVPEETYDERLERLVRRFDELPRGARMMASHDLELAPITVTSVLQGTRENADLLERLESWAAETTSADVANRRDRSKIRGVELDAVIDRLFEEHENGSVTADDAYLAYVAHVGEAQATGKSTFVARMRRRWGILRNRGVYTFYGVRTRQEPS